MSEIFDVTGAGAEPSDGQTLIMQRVFRASPETVFQAWVDPETVMKWWGPEGIRISECELDVTPGGAWRTVMIDPDGNALVVSGAYVEVLPPQRLVMTWAWDQEDGSRGHETKIIVTFEDVPEGTKIRLVQSVFESVEQRDNHDMGWSSTLNKLDHLFN